MKRSTFIRSLVGLAVTPLLPRIPIAKYIEPSPPNWHHTDITPVLSSPSEVWYFINDKCIKHKL